MLWQRVWQLRLAPHHHHPHHPHHQLLRREQLARILRVAIGGGSLLLLFLYRETRATPPSFAPVSHPLQAPVGTVTERPPLVAAQRCASRFDPARCTGAVRRLSGGMNVDVVSCYDSIDGAEVVLRRPKLVRGTGKLSRGTSHLRQELRLQDIMLAPPPLYLPLPSPSPLPSSLSASSVVAIARGCWTDPRRNDTMVVAFDAMDGDLLTVRERKGSWARRFSSDECVAREVMFQVTRGAWHAGHYH